MINEMHPAFSRSRKQNKQCIDYKRITLFTPDSNYSYVCVRARVCVCVHACLRMAGGGLITLNCLIWTDAQQSLRHLKGVYACQWLANVYMHVYAYVM